MKAMLYFCFEFHQIEGKKIQNKKRKINFHFDMKKGNKKLQKQKNCNLLHFIPVLLLENKKMGKLKNINLSRLIDFHGIKEYGGLHIEALVSHCSL